jgi:peptidoglycan/LPS O-acetylase OafA/YrhL
LAHIVLLQHMLDLEALSAGIWYVAIDLQLYVMALLSLTVVKVFGHTKSRHATHAWRWGMWLGLTSASLWWWNLHPDLDDHGVYFFGAYGLGCLAWEARRRQSLSGDPSQRWRVWALLLVLGGVAWWLEPRWRMAVACAIAGLLIAVPARWFKGEAVRFPWARQMVAWLSKVSYSVFLSHFGVSLAVNAGVTALWPELLWANALGMLGALLLSLLFGALLYRLVERHAPSFWRWWLWVGVFKASVALALFINPVA